MAKINEMNGEFVDNIMKQNMSKNLSNALQKPTASFNQNVNEFLRWNVYDFGQFIDRQKRITCRRRPMSDLREEKRREKEEEKKVFQR